MVQDLRGKEAADRLQDSTGRGVAARESGRVKDGKPEASGSDEAENDCATPEDGRESEALIAERAEELSDLFFHERPIDEEA
eukprot:450161-Alexandrium_andersonii.AAC.1